MFGESLMPLVRGEVESVRDRLLLSSPDAETAIRTPAWYLRQSDPPELFAKPDDRWEVNDVANRCHDVVDRLGKAAARLSRLSANRPARQAEAAGRGFVDGLGVDAVAPPYFASVAANSLRPTVVSGEKPSPAA